MLLKMIHCPNLRGNVEEFLPAKTPYVAQESQVGQQVTPHWSKYHGYPESSTSVAEPFDHASLWDVHIPHPVDHKVGK
jgi:hypothetical protein